MAPQRRMLLGLGTASCLLLLYLLCLHLDSPHSIVPFRSTNVLPSHRQSQTHSLSEGSPSTSAPDPSPADLHRDSHSWVEGGSVDGAESAKAHHRRAMGTVNPTSAGATTSSTTTKPGPKPEPKPEPESGPEPGPETGPESGPEPVPETGPEPGPETGPKPGPEPGPKPGPEPGPKPGPEPGPKPGPEPGKTDSPFIGDFYYTEEIPPLTRCPQSIRSLVQQSDFSSLFRLDIPVLQWAKHVSPEQYERLKQYPGAHGWGALSYQTLLDSLSVLDSPLSGRLIDDWPGPLNATRCIRCAVVGNGGILKDSKKGQEIDQHDYVFRTNGAVIQGFEADVGSRTTHYTFSVNTLRNSLSAYRSAGYAQPPQTKETRYVFLPDHNRDYLFLNAAATGSRLTSGPERNVDPVQFFGSDLTKEKLKIYHPDFIRYLRNRFLRSHAMTTKYKNIYRPSTGAVMLLAALHSCDQVSAYGFMTPDFRKYSDHYFDKTFHAVVFYINHDLRAEMSLWQQLHRVGLLHLYMRQDPDQDTAQNQV